MAWWKPLTILLTGLLVGCAPQSDATLAEKVGKLTQDYKQLEVKLEAVKTNGEFTRNFAMRLAESYSSATVDTTEKSYGVAKNKFGAFPIVARSIAPHLDGFKLLLDVGNMTEATFHGAKLSMRWGPNLLDLSENKVSADEYTKGQKTKDLSVTAVFRPGTYTTVEIVLAPAQPKDVKRIEVGVDFDQLSLRRLP